MMSAWPKYGHRSLEGYRLPHLCSYSWSSCIYGLTLFSDDLFCLRSWHRTNQWHDSLLPRDPLWLTCWFLLPHLSDLAGETNESIRVRKEANCTNRDGEPTTYQWPMTVFWSCTHRQRHVTICLMKFTVGQQNVAVRYIKFCASLCHMNIIIVANPTWWTFTNIYAFALCKAVSLHTCMLS